MSHRTSLRGVRLAVIAILGAGVRITGRPDRKTTRKPSGAEK